MASRTEAIRARIKQAREDSGLTMKQMARAIGVAHDVTIARYESGVREPDWDTLERIAEVTGKPLPWFFGADAAPEPPAPAAAPAPAPEAQAHAPSDAQALLAQLVAAQAQMMAMQVQMAEALARMQAESAQAVSDAVARAVAPLHSRLLSHSRELGRLHQEVKAHNRLNEAKYYHGHTRPPPPPGTEEVGG